MAILLANGNVADTGVPQESPGHQFMESTAHQRDSFPYKSGTLIGLTHFWASNWLGSPPVMQVYPAWDAAFIINDYDFPNHSWDYDTGNVDAYGYEEHLPLPDPIVVFDNSSTWSADATGQPYVGTAMTNTGGPLYEMCFNFGTSVTVSYKTWFKAGTYTDFGIAFRLGDSSSGAMNASFAGTLTMGPIVITFSRASGFSGTGVSGNTSTGSAPTGAWSAHFSHTFTEPFQCTVQMGPMSNYAGTPKIGGGFVEILISQ